MKTRILLTAAWLCAFSLYSQSFIQRSGNKLQLNEKEILLQGISFGNQVWNDIEIPDNHREADLRRVHELGMNAIRFYMNYKTFEDDDYPFEYKQSGWDWIDQNIAWAKKYNIYLILNIHVPQGGYQSQCKGDALWQDKNNQDRLVALWNAIAKRYANEPQVAAYDLLNEPTPSGTVLHWQNLAQRIVDTIRSVDNNHLLIAERANALDCDWSYNDGKNNYPILEEDNIMYTVHFYDPYEYTHQNQSWAGTGEGGKYPDEDRITPPGDAVWAYGQYNNPSIPAGNSDWDYYEGVPFSVDDDTVILAKPVFFGHRLGKGKAYFDLITVNEVDANGTVLKQIAELDFKTATDATWWSEKGTGSFGASTVPGPQDDFSLTLTGTTGYASVTVGSKAFAVQKGKYYSASAWIKGENIPATAVVSPTMEFYYSPSGSPLYKRNKQYLRERVLQSTQYLREQNYPIYFGEFGLVREDYEGKGGELWLKDILQLFDSLHFNFTYHAYREDAFGLYGGWDGPTDTTTVVPSIQNTFREFFNVPNGLAEEVTGAPITAKIYPNPSKTTFRIENPFTSAVTAKFMDATSVVVEEATIEPLGITTWGENSAPGLYYVQLNYKGRYATYKVVKE